MLVNNAGYRYEADKPYGTLWYNAGRISKIGDTFIEYMVDTEGGQSGSPVYFYDQKKGERATWSRSTRPAISSIEALKITPEVFETIRNWAGR